MTTAIMTVMKKKRGPKFRTLEPWQLLILAENEKNPKKLRKR